MCNNYFIFEGKKKLKFSFTVIPGGGRYFVILNFINYINMLKKMLHSIVIWEEKAENFTWC